MADLVWYVVRTEPRRESEAAKSLAALGPVETIEVYLPMSTRWARVRRGKRSSKRTRVRCPAFPGYLFLGVAGLPDWLRVRMCPGVLGVVANEEHVPLRMGQDEVDEVRAHEDMGMFDFTVELRQVVVGGRVMLTSGPLDGYVAVVTRVPKAETKPVEVAVDMMGRSVGAIVPIDKLRVLA